MSGLEENLSSYLHSFEFQNLFVEELGWNTYRGEKIITIVDNQEYVLESVAKKASFAVYVCNPDSDGNIPNYPIRRRIEQQTTKKVYEHLIIFVDAGKTVQVWQWVKREKDKPAAYREHSFYAKQTGKPLLQRLDKLHFTLEDESKGINITDVTTAVRKGLDVEKVTRRFYDHFKTELNVFQGFIDGIAVQDDREWYASLMLNRMMFVYFVQKQNFLDNDPDYLRNRLRVVQSKYGQGKFQQFYNDFLIKLFHAGLGQPESKRDTGLRDLLGKVPYLNGGLFDVHDLERNYPKIRIPDEAFERIFDFFDRYRWHLDERPMQEDNEINPDVLGYIFEKYINQKQMGAYYTKDDITGYITRNTVIPFLLDASKKECMVSFNPNGNIWNLLQDDPDRYIYASMGHGISWNYSDDADPTALEKPLDLPDEIAVGLNDVSKREGWNRPAPAKYALPTETWREVVTRRRRYTEVRDKMTSGEVTDVNDIITLNLDIERFAKDVIRQSEGPELLRALWHAINNVSVLDPTCGSGAFLFAALNILEPLYTACLEGMRGFVDDLERSKRPHSHNTLSDFRTVLSQADKHPNQRYFILKSIVLNNLFGVDIMEEAVEICKLRLFLKMMAQLEKYDQIEPLPDIDFNIRAGNTLVGFTSLDAVERAIRLTADGQERFLTDADKATIERISNAAKTASQTFDQFRNRQIVHGEITQDDKDALRSRFDTLRNELDGYLATEYSVDTKDKQAYDSWRASHRPFNWFVEFHGIMSRGGFDVVVGNPPYVEYSKIRKEYVLKNYRTERCGNLYAMVIERSYDCLRLDGRFGMIVQLSYSCTDRMEPTQNLCRSQSGGLWLSHFDDRPAKLFDGLEHIRATIVLSIRSIEGADHVYSTAYNRWYKESRPQLFDTVTFDSISINAKIPKGTMPKIGILPASTILRRITKHQPIRNNLYSVGRWITYFHNAPQYWIRAMDFVPYFWNERDGEQLSTQVKILKFKNKTDAQVVVATLNSSLFYWWFILLSDCRHLNLREIENFPLGLEQMSKNTKTQLAKTVARLMDNFQQNSRRKETRYKTTGKVVYDEFDQKPSKPIVDEIDKILAKHYGFAKEELDFIINYDIKYRMGWKV